MSKASKKEQEGKGKSRATGKKDKVDNKEGGNINTEKWLCPACNTQNPAKVKRCVGCGDKKPVVTEEEEKHDEQNSVIPQLNKRLEQAYKEGDEKRIGSLKMLIAVEVAKVRDVWMQDKYGYGIIRGTPETAEAPKNEKKTRKKASPIIEPSAPENTETETPKPGEPHDNATIPPVKKTRKPRTPKGEGPSQRKKLNNELECWETGDTCNKVTCRHYLQFAGLGNCTLRCSRVYTLKEIAEIRGVTPQAAEKELQKIYKHARKVIVALAAKDANVASLLSTLDITTEAE